MITVRLIETAMEIESPMDVYGNAQNNILSILKYKFQGKCFRNSYIKNIISIERISNAIILDTSAECKCQVNVIFKAEVIIYSVGETIHECSIINKSEELGIFVMRSEYAVILLEFRDNKLGNLSKGNKIPVRVASVGYKHSKEFITINATPYIPNKYFPAKIIHSYQIAEQNLEDPEKEDLQEMMRMIENQEKTLANHRSMDNSKVKFFEELLYGYKSQSDKNTEHVERLPLFEVINEIIKNGSNSIYKNGYFVRDPRIYTTSREVDKYATEPEQFSLDETVSTYAGMQILLQDYYDRIFDLNQFIDIYKSAEMVEEHSNLWKIMVSHRI